ncbi:LigA [Pseudonocardia sp. Ae168_Ps1]|nr:LigA [Pseudonocardia sp. Ae168_Ps1]OLL84046.1 hypothetical protein Ae263Ps1_1101 [Pseudonocardia sp. Ae263_Ps1]
MPRQPGDPDPDRAAAGDRGRDAAARPGTTRDRPHRRRPSVPRLGGWRARLVGRVPGRDRRRCRTHRGAAAVRHRHRLSVAAPGTARPVPRGTSPRPAGTPHRRGGCRTGPARRRRGGRRRRRCAGPATAVARRPHPAHHRPGPGHGLREGGGGPRRTVRRPGPGPGARRRRPLVPVTRRHPGDRGRAGHPRGAARPRRPRVRDRCGPPPGGADERDGRPARRRRGRAGRVPGRALRAS